MQIIGVGAALIPTIRLRKNTLEKKSKYYLKFYKLLNIDQLNKIVNNAFYIALILTLIIIFQWLGYFYYSKTYIYNDITFTNIAVLVIYFLVINFIIRFGNSLSKSKFLLVVFAYSATLALLYILIYHNYTGDFFDFQRGDTIAYHNAAIHYKNYSFKDFISNFLQFNNWDDLGVIIYVRFLYKIIESPLFVYFSNIVIALFSTSILYKLSRLYLSHKESLVASALFALSSYFIYFQVSLFKESLFVLLCIIAIYSAQKIIDKNNLKSIFILIISLSLLSLFRIGTPILILFSYLLYNFLRSMKFNIKSMIVLILFIPILYYSLFPLFISTYGKYANVEFLSYYVNTSGYNFSFLNQLLISIFSALFGPIPSFVALKEHEISSFYYAGYLVKYLLTPYFIIAAARIVKHKMFSVYPLLIYYLVGSLAFGISLRGFDMRFLVTHSFLFYPIVFIGIRDYKIKSKKQHWFLILSYFVLIVIFFLFNSRF